MGLGIGLGLGLQKGVGSGGGIEAIVELNLLEVTGTVSDYPVITTDFKYGNTFDLPSNFVVTAIGLRVNPLNASSIFSIRLYEFGVALLGTSEAKSLTDAYIQTDGSGAPGGVGWWVKYNFSTPVQCNASVVYQMRVGSSASTTSKWYMTQNVATATRKYTLYGSQYTYNNQQHNYRIYGYYT